MYIASLVAIRFGVVFVAAVLWHAGIPTVCGEEPTNTPVTKTPVAAGRRELPAPQPCSGGGGSRPLWRRMDAVFAASRRTMSLKSR